MHVEPYLWVVTAGPQGPGFADPDVAAFPIEEKYLAHLIYHSCYPIPVKAPHLTTYHTSIQDNCSLYTFLAVRKRHLSYAFRIL